MTMYAQNEQQKNQTKQIEATAQYNAQEAANQQAVQEQLASNEISKGIADRERLVRDQQRRQGELTSMLGGSGFDMDSGSTLSLLAESAGEAQYDAQMVSRNSEFAAWQHLAGANSAQNQQNLFNYQKDNANSGKAANYLNMGATLLGGVGQGLGQYNAYQQTKSPAQGNYWNGSNTYSGTSGIGKIKFGR